MSMKGGDSTGSAVRAVILPTGYNWQSTKWVQPMWITVTRRSVDLQFHATHIKSHLGCQENVSKDFFFSYWEETIVWQKIIYTCEILLNILWPLVRNLLIYCVASAQNRICCIQIGNRCLPSERINSNLSHYMLTFSLDPRNMFFSF